MRSRFGTMGDLEKFAACHHLNIYSGKGRVWDHTGRIIAENTWWTKLMLDEATIEAYALGTGRSWHESLRAAVDDFNRNGVRIASHRRR